MIGKEGKALEREPRTEQTITIVSSYRRVGPELRKDTIQGTRRRSSSKSELQIEKKHKQERPKSLYSYVQQLCKC
jgi:hypothetical protein